ncbi:MAG: HAD-IB family hydrolase [Candidatus Cloacimonadota bacterium]|nr:MAG: HAD-IB family hydrolase [Candidatus Cloacimonadota bacterium]
MGKKIAFFDFDGTITNADSFFRFVIFATPWSVLILKGIRLLPMLILYKLKLISNHKAKAKALRVLFKGVSEEKMKGFGKEFYDKRVPSLLKKSALDKMKWHKDEGHTVYLVSASVNYWLEEFTKVQEIGLICTTMEVQNGVMTGEQSSKNCYGEEKVRRIKEVVNLSDYEYSYAYGDTRGDKEMLEMVDEDYFCYFH